MANHAGASPIPIPAATQKPCWLITLRPVEAVRLDLGVITKMRYVSTLAFFAASWLVFSAPIPAHSLEWRQDENATSQDDDTAEQDESDTSQDDDTGTDDTGTDDQDSEADDRTVSQEPGRIDFARDIRPILEKRCMRCHAPPDPREGFDFSIGDAVIGDYVTPGDPDNSDFYFRMVTDDHDFMMPPPDDGGPMPLEESFLVRLWILEGADWPEEIELKSPQNGGATSEDPPNGDPSNGSEARRVIDFERDVAPLLVSRCIQCHGPDNPKEGISFVNRDDVIGNYVFPGDPGASSLYKRMTATDPDKMMPPPAEGGPVSGAEALVIKLWIEEGAQWPDGVTLDAANGDDESPVESKSWLGAAWTFQGYFHPATVHFPVALISIAAVFVILHWLFGGGFRDAAFYCLFFGALSSIAAVMMGWALSPAVGFGSNAFDPSDAVFRHRWLGIGTSIGAVTITVLAIRARKVEKERRLERTKKDLPWQIGVLFLALMVGIVGHQGGELTYGEGWYDRAFSHFDSVDNESSENTGTPESDSRNSSSNNDPPDGSNDDDSNDNDSNEDDSNEDDSSGDTADDRGNDRSANDS